MSERLSLVIEGSRIPNALFFKSTGDDHQYRGNSGRIPDSNLWQIRYQRQSFASLRNNFFLNTRRASRCFRVAESSQFETGLDAKIGIFYKRIGLLGMIETAKKTRTFDLR